MTKKLFRKSGADLPDPSPSDEANRASVVQLHAQATISDVTSREVLDLDPVDLSRRRALGVKDAVEAEILLTKAMRLTAEQLVVLQEAKEEAGEKTAELKIELHLGKVMMRLARAVTAYVTLKAVNDASLDELRAFAERTSGVDNAEIINRLVAQYLDAAAREDINLTELKQRAAASGG